jgi:molybdate transport system substrate-binding protein
MQTVHNFMLAKRRQTLTSPSRRTCLVTVATGLGLGITALARAEKGLRVLAASDLKFVLAYLINQYQQSGGGSVQAVYGSSGNLARQIQQGLQADLFFSADEALVQRLESAGLTQGPGTVYGLGRLVLLARRGASAAGPALDARLAGLGQMLRQPPAGFKLAIANPDHAPYGRAAREALQASGLWAQAQPHLVLGDSVAQATQFVTSGAAQVALSAHALALAPELAATTEHVLIDAALHAPLRQRMVLLRGAGSQAQHFADHLQSGAARAVWARWGFAGDTR